MRGEEKRVAWCDVIVHGRKVGCPERGKFGSSGRTDVFSVLHPHPQRPLAKRCTTTAR